jgi:hypothetical protein
VLDAVWVRLVVGVDLIEEGAELSELSASDKVGS